MCKRPKIAEPQRLQQSESPVYRDRYEKKTTGRRSTILTGGGGLMQSAASGKKTILGQ